MNWKKVGELSTVTVWVSDQQDWNLETVKEELIERGFIVRKCDGYIEFVEDVFKYTPSGYIKNFEDIVKSKETRHNFFLEVFYKQKPWLCEIDVYVVADEKLNKEIRWKNDLKPFKAVRRIREISGGIERVCNFEDGTRKTILQGGTVYDRYICPAEILLAFHRDAAYAFIIHETTKNEKVLLKFDLKKWSWHLYSDEGETYLLDTALELVV